MTTLLDFIKITRIEGVESYCLIRADGRCMAGNAMYTDGFYNTLSRMVKRGNKTTEKGPLSSPTCLWIRGPKESLLLIPFGDYTVGVTPCLERSEQKIMEEVLAFLQRIRHQHTVSQKS